MPRFIIAALLAAVLVLVGVCMVWIGPGISPVFALDWSNADTSASAAPGANTPTPTHTPTSPSGSGPDTLKAFGLVGPASCRTTEPPTNSPWLRVARADAVKYKLDPIVFNWKIYQESGFNPDVVSPAGAIGIAQFMPETAASMGIDPHNPTQALDASARLDAAHLRQYAQDARTLANHYGGWSARYGYALALAAYNAGPGALQTAWNRAFGAGWPSSPWAWLRLMALETRNYIPDITNCSTL